MTRCSRPATRWSASAEPTPPAPWIRTVRPDGSPEPNTCARLARIPWKTPTAVGGAGIAGPAAPRRAAEHVGRPLPDHIHVGLAGVHVGARPIGPAEGSDEIAVAQEQLAARLPARDLGDRDHPLATAERQPGDGQLARHRPRQPDRVGKPGGRGLVDPQARTAAGGAEPRRVDADEHPAAGLAITVDDRGLAVPSVQQRLEVRHGCIRSETRPFRGEPTRIATMLEPGDMPPTSRCPTRTATR